jgi:hypothetical protein
LAEFLHAFKLDLDILVGFVGDAGGVAVESLLLGSVPVLVESTLDGFVQVLGPDGGQGTETAGGFEVTNETDNVHGRALEDGDGFDGFLLVELGTGLVDFTEDVSHTGLVTDESGQVAFLGLVITGKALDFASLTRATLTGQETQRTTAGMFKFTVRHD